MKIIRVANDAELGKTTGQLIEDRINANPNIVLGLATGSSPISTYKYLVEETKAGKIDWTNVKTFNLDEYKGISGEHEHSYKYFMKENLFDHININQENTHIPSGMTQTNEEAEKYDEMIKEAGGIDLQLLGIGINGHIGFNEPDTSFYSKTSIVDLTPSTIEANSRFFASKEEVPTQAISMGLKTIVSAKEIVLIAMGDAKAQAIYQLVEGDVSELWPCSILQNHDNVTIIIDEAAGKLLKNN